MTFNEVCSYAARELPETWLLEMHLEKAAGWLTLYDEDGQVRSFPTNFESMEETVLDAVGFARNAAGLPAASPIEPALAQGS
jgi:hypothetical protein